MSSDILKYKRLPINLDGKLANLTDMWKAAGSKEGRKPKVWLKLAHTEELITTLMKQMGVRNRTPIIQTVLGRGKAQGTYGHWQLALACR